MKRNAIVIVYTGEEPPVECIRAIGEATMRFTDCEVGALEIYTLNEKEIAGSIVAKAIDTERRDAYQEYTAEEAAAIYLRTLYRDTTPAAFAAQVSTAYALAVIQGHDDNIISAVQAIGQGRIENISIGVRKKHHFNTTEFNIVKDIYSSCAGHFARLSPKTKHITKMLFRTNVQKSINLHTKKKKTINAARHSNNN